MIVWIASFPRSGNTFLRIVLHRCFGVRTAVAYDFDGVAGRVGQELVGFQDRVVSYDEMRASRALHFIKTHRQRDERIHENDQAICLVRDGRDALVSWAHLRSEADRRPFRAHLEEAILTRAERGTGGWGQNVLSWLRSSGGSRAVLHYEELVKEPAAAVTATMKALRFTALPCPEAHIPTFAELQRVDQGFFRRGLAGSHADEMPRDLHDLFWSIPDNAAAMALIGRRGDDS